MNQKSKTTTPKAKESPITVYNFRKNWGLVRKFLPKTERALGQCMLLFLLENGHAKPKYDSLQGPWSYSTKDHHLSRACEETERAIQRGEFKWQPPGPGARKREEEQRWNEFFQFSNRYNPKPQTVEWYQLFGGCHWLVPWQVALGGLMFPHFLWIPVFGDFHSFAAGMDRKGRIQIVFDILNFEEMPAKELFKLVSLKVKRAPTQKYKKPHSQFLTMMTPNIVATTRGEAKSK